MSGLDEKDARAAWTAIEAERTEVDVAGTRAWVLRALEAVAQPGDDPVVRLLPKYDGYPLGHRGRDLILSEEHADRVQPRNTEIRATVLADGRVVGTSALDRSRSTAVVRVGAFERFGSAVEAGFEREVEDIGRFLRSDITLEMRR